MANKQMIGFRLKKVTDDDLAAIIESKTGEEISNICKTALRQAFGITSHKQKIVKFVDVPVVPGVWKPGGKGRI